MPAPDMTLSERLADWVAALRYEDLPAEAVHQVRRSLLDHLGVTIAGAGTSIARTLRNYLLSSEGPGRASLPGTDIRLSVPNAAFANATAASVLELDDGHAAAPIHIGATAIPPILATAQAQNASARDVIVAIAAANEVAARLAIATLPANEKGFNPTPLIGVFGAVAGTSRILGSDARATAHALGMAGAYTGGLFDYHGGWLDSWYINVGRTARDGLICAYLADASLAGPLDIFHGPRGIANAFTDGRLDAEETLRDLGRKWLIGQTYVKPYPCCRRVHAIIDAVLALRPQLPSDPDAIDRIVVETSAATARLDGRIFDSMAAAQMSIGFSVATTLLFGAPRLEHFSEGIRRDPRIHALVARTEARASDDAQMRGWRSSARVSISAGGETKIATIREPLGNPDNPIDDQALEAKFLDLAGPVIGQQQAFRLARLLWRFGDGPDALDRGGGLTFLRSLVPAQPGAFR